MSLDAIMDAVSVRAATMQGLKACYSAASSSEGATIMPRSVDDSPIGIVLFDGDEAEAGNFETVVIDRRTSPVRSCYSMSICFFPEFSKSFLRRISSNPLE